MLLLGYRYVFIPGTKGLGLDEVRHSFDFTANGWLKNPIKDEMYCSGVKPWDSAK
jgi:hypothetical protein